VTGSDGTSITCAVPAGLDVTPFLSGRVKAHCELVNGVLTVSELEGANGAKAEVKDDGTVEPNGEDEGENEAGDDADDDGASSSASSGSGSAVDKSGSGEGDHGGHDGGGGGDD
jgi:hypothetical protein